MPRLEAALTSWGKSRELNVMVIEYDPVMRFPRCCTDRVLSVFRRILRRHLPPPPPRGDFLLRSPRIACNYRDKTTIRESRPRYFSTHRVTIEVYIYEK